MPERELRTLVSSEGRWHPLAYNKLLRRMDAQSQGLRSGCVQSVTEYFCFAYFATEFLRLNPRADRIRTLKADVARETAAIENVAPNATLVEERKLMMRVVRALQSRADQLPNAPS